METSSTRNARKIVSKKRENAVLGQASPRPCSRLCCNTIHFSPSRLFTPCLNTLVDRVECRLQTRRAIFFAFPFFCSTHLLIQRPSHPLLTLSWSISPKILTRQTDLGLDPRHPSSGSPTHSVELENLTMSPQPTSLFLVTNPDLDRFTPFSF